MSWGTIGNVLLAGADPLATPERAGWLLVKIDPERPTGAP
jgi:hypothetical protein